RSPGAPGGFGGPIRRGLGHIAGSVRRGAHGPGGRELIADSGHGDRSGANAAALEPRRMNPAAPTPNAGPPIPGAGLGDALRPLLGAHRTATSQGHCLSPSAVARRAYSPGVGGSRSTL